MTDDDNPRPTFGRRRKRVAWAILVALALYFVGLPAWRHFATPPPLNLAGFDDIQIGMTMAEVESLLGGPPGDYGRYGGDGAMSTESVEWPPGSVQTFWWNDDHRLEVWFDRTNWTVVKVHRRASYIRRPSDLHDTLYTWFLRLKRAVGY